jgi:hypothetical protein
MDKDEWIAGSTKADRDSTVSAWMWMIHANSIASSRESKLVWVKWGCKQHATETLNKTKGNNDPASLHAF